MADPRQQTYDCAGADITGLDLRGRAHTMGRSIGEMFFHTPGRTRFQELPPLETKDEYELGSRPRRVFVITILFIYLTSAYWKQMRVANS